MRLKGVLGAKPDETCAPMREKRSYVRAAPPTQLDFVLSSAANGALYIHQTFHHLHQQLENRCNILVQPR
jgi:hypothetical protein